MKTLIALAVLLLSNSVLAAALSGEVLEVRDVAPYTYLRLKTAQGETWAAVTQAPVKKGEKVTIANPSVMENFHSKTLDKTFDRIVFGTLSGPGAAAAPGAPAATAQASPHGAMGSAKPAAPAAAAPVKVAKASGSDARTVAEVVGGKATLKDKSVSLRGQVVKANLGIMGKNWFHLQDGSGSAGAGTNDVLVTSRDVAAVGDVVVVKGTVRTDVKLGSGYEYAVLIEDASLKK
jgi:sporulation protein YlmC with PRC-barrel domain